MGGVIIFLSGKDISKAMIKGEKQEEGIRAISYDLCVGSIIKEGEKVFNILKNHKVTIPRATSFKLFKFIKPRVVEKDDVYIDCFKIKPQEIVNIIMKEKVRIPEDCFGIVYSKTALCKKGIHLLNVGVIDPGYSGYISTLAINFSKEAVEVRKGDAFIRLMVYKNAHDFEDAKPFEDVNYIEKRIAESKKYPNTFLDVPRQVKELSREMSSEISSSLINKTLFILTGLTVLITLISFWYGNSRIQTLQDAILGKTPISNESSYIEDLQKDNDDFKLEMLKLFEEQNKNYIRLQEDYKKLLEEKKQLSSQE